MSRGWTPEELQRASQAMKSAGHLSYEEFCAEVERIEQNSAIAPLVSRWAKNAEPIALHARQGES